MQKLKIVWDQEASYEFSKHIKYIRNNSPKNADNVKKAIIEIIRSLITYPEKHSPDKYKIENSEHQYRAFEKYKLRITYRLYDNTIRIIRVRHTSQNPQSY